jgi:hypothetical protein
VKTDEGKRGREREIKGGGEKPSYSLCMLSAGFSEEQASKGQKIIPGVQLTSVVEDAEGA